MGGAPGPGAGSCAAGTEGHAARSWEDRSGAPGPGCPNCTASDASCPNCTASDANDDGANDHKRAGDAPAPDDGLAHANARARGGPRASSSSWAPPPPIV